MSRKKKNNLHKKLDPLEMKIYLKKLFWSILFGQFVSLLIALVRNVFLWIQELEKVIEYDGDVMGSAKSLSERHNGSAVIFWGFLSW